MDKLKVTDIDGQEKINADEFAKALGAEKIQTGASKTNEAKFGDHDSVTFKCGCGCGNNECDATLDYSYEDGWATLTIYKKMWTHEKCRAYWKLEDAERELWKLEDKVEEGLLEKKEIYKYWVLHILPHKIGILWHRIKLCGEILWTGMAEIEGEITITDPKHMQGIKVAVDEGTKKMFSYEEDWKNTRDKKD